jgi:hypothetical protein
MKARLCLWQLKVRHLKGKNMFEEKSPDISGLEDFIEKNRLECKPEELKAGVDKVLFVLGKNPVAIMNVISGHQFIPGTFLLDELADKMKMQGCLEKLGMLYDKCLNEIVKTCIWNYRDLARCISNLPAPSYKQIVMKKILSEEDQMKLILAADKDPAGTLDIIEKQYPEYKDEFRKCYDKHFNSANTFRR